MAKDEILIRVLNPTTQKVKNVFPDIASNKQLMKNVGFIISDPNYDAKMDAFKNKRAYSENGQTLKPASESFAPAPMPNIEQPKVEQPKNEIATPVITDEPVKRKRGRQAGSKNKSKTIKA